ncbi:molybdopterin-guanine dinucleotide biosynthesis protein A [Prauserella sp. Am3]|nr:molybdopterin-guanine dinucleotide biosynthesis protein A [Prauserella sp. Am3]
MSGGRSGDVACVVLAGGGASRLGGVDKPMLEVGGRTLLSRAIDAGTAGTAGARAAAVDVVVVGPRRAGVDGVRWVRERPPGGGPVAALAAGLSTVDAPVVVVLAADLKGVRPETVARLLSALGEPSAQPGPDDSERPDGAVLVDAEGRRQWLLSVWRTAAARGALPREPAGRSLRASLGGLRIVEVPAVGDEAADVDTPGDL